MNNDIYLKIYDGGSNKDELINSVTGTVKSLRNQIFIMFTTDSNGFGKGFTATITLSI